jgi:hypothetical protein
VNPSGSWLYEDPGLSLEEKELLLFLLDDSQTLQCSIVSASFEDVVQESLRGSVPAAWPVLKDAYLAYAGVLKSLHSEGYVMQASDCTNYRHVTSALMTLRSLQVTNMEDAELCLAVGFALALSVYAAIGVGVSDICHYCLSMTRPFIETAAINPDSEPRISFLVLMEIMECTVYRRKPTLRIQLRTSGSVDRHLGLSLPLLPYYHDLCIISHSLIGNIDTKSIGLLQKQLEEIHTHVEKWQPSQPEGFIHDFGTVEVIHLLAQAKAYRLAALLLIHRLQHKFGYEDSQADVLSREVMMELELAQRVSLQPVRFVTLPFIVAAVEIRGSDERDKAIRNVDRYVDQFTPVVQNATKTFLSRVWQERDVQTGFSWFDSIHKPCVVLDSISGGGSLV